MHAIKVEKEATEQLQAEAEAMVSNLKSLATQCLEGEEFKLSEEKKEKYKWALGQNKKAEVLPEDFLKSLFKEVSFGSSEPIFKPGFKLAYVGCAKKEILRLLEVARSASLEQIGSVAVKTSEDVKRLMIEFVYAVDALAETKKPSDINNIQIAMSSEELRSLYDQSFAYKALEKNEAYQFLISPPVSSEDVDRYKRFNKSYLEAVRLLLPVPDVVSDKLSKIREAIIDGYDERLAEERKRFSVADVADTEEDAGRCFSKKLSEIRPVYSYS